MVLAMFDRVVELQAEVAALKAELQAASARLVEQEHASHSAYGNVIDEIKAELAAAQKDSFRAGMLAAAEMERSKGK